MGIRGFGYAQKVIRSCRARYVCSLVVRGVFPPLLKFQTLVCGGRQGAVSGCAGGRIANRDRRSESGVVNLWTSECSAGAESRD